MVLAGAQTCYLDAYPLHDYSMYGTVPLRRIKQALLEYRRAGKLDRYGVGVGVASHSRFMA